MSAAETPERWFSEVLHDAKGVRFTFRADKVFVEEQTELQHLVLFDTAGFGKVLMLDGITQLTTADEFVYHEMMAHVPILAHGKVRKVLIIGGGDGGIAREVLKHKGVEKLTMVEIDGSVVDFSREHLPEVSDGAFDDPRFELIIADGAAFVRETEERYDVVLVDSTDPIGPAKVLFTAEFYAGCKQAMTPGGILITQSGSPLFQGEELRDGTANLKVSYADPYCFVAATPTYVGGFFAMGWGTDNADLRQIPLEVLEKRYAEAGITTRYYAPGVHKGAFALPPYVEAHVKAGLE